MNIGIDDNRNLFYEGSSSYGHAIWPSPVITSARIVFASEGDLVAGSQHEHVRDTWVFREDVFDPVSRIRRGRLYQSGNTQPEQWYLQVHPAIHQEIHQADSDGLISKRLTTYYGNPIWHRFLKGQAEQPLVLLGTDERFTIWTIINIETISTGEELVMLKARSGLGAIPDIDEKKIPELHRIHVLDSLNNLADEIYRASPVSVIDRARDAVTVMLSCFAQSEGIADARKDLGKLITALGHAKPIRQVVIDAANIIRIFHARGKSSEQATRAIRPIREQDAELAVQCVGTVLCDLGWATW